MTDIIKKKRKQMGMTQKELADKCGVSYQSISNLETGKTFSLNLLTKVCNVLGLSFNIIDDSPIEVTIKRKKDNRVAFIE